jgi:hypothetical protein
MSRTTVCYEKRYTNSKIRMSVVSVNHVARGLSKDDPSRTGIGRHAELEKQAKS